MSNGPTTQGAIGTCDGPKGRDMTLPSCIAYGWTATTTLIIADFCVAVCFHHLLWGSTQPKRGPVGFAYARAPHIFPPPPHPFEERRKCRIWEGQGHVQEQDSDPLPEQELKRVPEQEQRCTGAPHATP